ncbi:MAG: methionyl-tRNA formyltransferase [Actinomycetota bacterium]|nr:methionyl-tRNA formyltransferase [Actinomycetota bacterium]
MPPLQALLADGHEIAVVVTQPDRRRGRGGAVVPTPVKAAAVQAGLRVTDRVDDVVDAGVELGVVVAFGKLIKPHVLERVPMVNLHFSLLPRWRGAAPVERAILAGDTETGVCLMGLEEGLDTGPVYRREAVEVGADETAAELRERLVAVGTCLLVEALRQGLGDPEPQVGEPTYAAKLDPDELRLDWARAADELERVVRVGRAWTTFRGRRLIVLRACAHRVTGAGVVVPTGTDPMELLLVQPEGRGPMAAADWARGARWRPGEPLGS